MQPRLEAPARCGLDVNVLVPADVARVIGVGPFAKLAGIHQVVPARALKKLAEAK